MLASATNTTKNVLQYAWRRVGPWVMWLPVVGSTLRWMGVPEPETAQLATMSNDVMISSDVTPEIHPAEAATAEDPSEEQRIADQEAIPYAELNAAVQQQDEFLESPQLTETPGKPEDEDDKQYLVEAEDAKSDANSQTSIIDTTHQAAIDFVEQLPNDDVESPEPTAAEFVNELSDDESDQEDEKSFDSEDEQATTRANTQMHATEHKEEETSELRKREHAPKKNPEPEKSKGKKEEDVEKRRQEEQRERDEERHDNKKEPEETRRKKEDREREAIAEARKISAEKHKENKKQEEKREPEEKRDEEPADGGWGDAHNFDEENRGDDGGSGDEEVNSDVEERDDDAKSIASDVVPRSLPHGPMRARPRSFSGPPADDAESKIASSSGYHPALPLPGAAPHSRTRPRASTVIAPPASTLPVVPAMFTAPASPPAPSASVAIGSAVAPSAFVSATPIVSTSVAAAPVVPSSTAPVIATTGNTAFFHRPATEVDANLAESPVLNCTVSFTPSQEILPTDPLFPRIMNGEKIAVHSASGQNYEVMRNTTSGHWDASLPTDKTQKQPGETSQQHIERVGKLMIEMILHIMQSKPDTITLTGNPVMVEIGKQFIETWNTQAKAYADAHPPLVAHQFTIVEAADKSAAVNDPYYTNPTTIKTLGKGLILDQLRRNITSGAVPTSTAYFDEAITRGDPLVQRLIAPAAAPVMRPGHP